MNLYSNSWYLTRGGRLVEIMNTQVTGGFVAGRFQGETRQELWNEDGTFYGPNKEHTWDLIESCYPIRDCSCDVKMLVSSGHSENCYKYRR